MKMHRTTEDLDGATGTVRRADGGAVTSSAKASITNGAGKGLRLYYGSSGSAFGRLKSSATKPIQAAAPMVMALSAALNTGKLNQP